MFKRIIKDYFSFSKKERVAVVVLVFMITIIFVLPHIIPRIDRKSDKLQLQEFEKDLASLRYSKRDSAITNGNHYKQSSYDDVKGTSENVHVKNALFYFDPNTLPEDGWKKLGLRDNLIRTIRKYISKGGTFREPEDIRKIYGMHGNDAERLLPYIRIKATSNKDDQESVAENHKPSSPSDPFDLNLADTTTLMTLPGIGSKLASRILSFREKLGGFYSLDQLGDVYNLPDSTIRKIRPLLTVSGAAVVQININTADVNVLKSHPYIKWNLANAIVAYRQQHGDFKSLNDLLKIDVVDREQLSKFSPYLTIQ